MWDVVIAGVVGTAVGGVVAGWVVLHLQKRLNRREAGALARMAARAVALDEIDRKVNYYLAEISHAAGHVVADRSHSHYQEDLERYLLDLRRLSRESVAIVGPAFVDAVVRYTDSAKAELPDLKANEGFSESTKHGATVVSVMILGMQSMEGPPAPLAYGQG